jgi:hypothetical protein
MGYVLANSWVQAENNREQEYDSLDSALDQWLSENNDIELLEGDESIIHLYSDGDTIIDTWTLKDAFMATERNLAMLEQFLDGPEIGTMAVSSNGFSVDQQIFDALVNLEHETFLDIVKKFPEITNVQWSGSSVDWEAMYVDQEWSMWLLEEIEQSSDIQWIEGEPYMVGLRTLEFGDK